ncbi:unnamed protein product [Oncorhynchus mykiss]|uniref:Rel homology dimerisation domain-containing protein n=1 Tax=Oncorhynchus mykiss TaxID=8022 RepID=A0A060W9L5_ONCMY|nr:unnamed protein product [Oncorhynchus mykiss]
MDGIAFDFILQTSLLIEIPPYRNQRISNPVQVNFYVCNGKRKRSQYQHFTYMSANVPIIKMEPNDDYDPPQVCPQRGPGLALRTKPYYTPQVMTSIIPTELRPCVGGTYSACQRRLGGKPSSLSSSSSPSTSPKLHDLSPTTPFSKCLSAGPSQSPIPDVSIIQESSECYQPQSVLYPPSSASSSPGSQPSTPDTSGPEAPFSPTHCLTPPQPISGSSSPVTQFSKVPERGSRSSSPTLAINIKQEPEELDQMYLDDVNEIIRNDLSSISVHSHA